MQKEIDIPWPHSPAPREPGVHEIREEPLDALVPFIDWFGLFYAWNIQGRFPQILEGDDPKADAARKLYDDAQVLLSRVVERRMLSARAVFGVFPARRTEDEILLDVDGEQIKVEFLRQQESSAATQPMRSLSDFLSPREQDYLGMFALSAGFGVRECAADYINDGDDYSAMLLHTLAGRLTEAFAEKLHREVMTHCWGYLKAGEKPFGIRPAPGYPACPDHTEKKAIWKALDVEKRIGIALTDSYMMVPENSICGYYFAHPASRYFGVGRIGDDQLSEYAARKGWSLDMAKKWLYCRR